MPITASEAFVAKLCSRVYDFRKAWASACRRAGIQAGKGGRLFHDLRRTRVRNLRRAGVDRKIAMAISGHRTEAVFERYSIDTDDELREAVGKLASYVDGLPRTVNASVKPWIDGGNNLKTIAARER